MALVLHWKKWHLSRLAFSPSFCNLPRTKIKKIDDSLIWVRAPRDFFFVCQGLLYMCA